MKTQKLTEIIRNKRTDGVFTDDKTTEQATQIQ